MVRRPVLCLFPNDYGWRRSRRRGMFACDQSRINRACRGVRCLSASKKGRDMMRLAMGFGALSALAVLTWPAAVTAAEMRGVTSTEIKIGQTMPYSGPVSAFGALG